MPDVAFDLSSIRLREASMQRQLRPMLGLFRYQKLGLGFLNLLLLFGGWCADTEVIH